MEKNCTCTIKVVHHVDKRISVEAFLSHYGHRRNLQHIWLSKKKRQEITAKLKQGVTKQKILDDIRESIGAQFARDHLIDKQDIANIKRRGGIDEIQRHPNDMMSVLGWIHELNSKEQKPILYYKLQGMHETVYNNQFVC